jgi:flavin reductase (DIM6/NTAB) family NADH-FMN oxidoreductase RutF
MILNCASIKTKILYHLLTATVAPRPIAWVSTRGTDGTSNIAPFSFYNVFCIAPPVLGFAPGYKDANKLPKDTLRNIQDTGEFTVNFVDESLLHQMNETSADVPRHISEFTLTNLKTTQGVSNQCPAVSAAKISMECSLRQIIDLGGSALILGNIQYLHIQDSLLKEALQQKEKVLEQELKQAARRKIELETESETELETELEIESEKEPKYAHKNKQEETKTDWEFLKALLLTGEIELDATILRPVGRLGGNQYLSLNGLEDIPRPSHR